MQKKLKGSLEIFGILMSKIKYNFDFSQPPNSKVPPDVLQEFESIKKSKEKQFNEILNEPEMKQIMEESKAQIDYYHKGPHTIPQVILDRKITLNMSEEFFATWVEKAFDDLIEEKPLHKESINEFYKENFDVGNKYT